MSKLGLLVIGCVSVVGMVGCAMDTPADGEPGQERAAEESRVAPKDIGAFFHIQLDLTNLCVQPAGGSTDDVPLELATCVPMSPQQNWLIKAVSGGTEILNNQSGKCMYLNGQTSGAQVIHSECNVFGKTVAASNALWNVTNPAGESLITSQVGHRNSGLCLNATGDLAGDTLDVIRCTEDQTSDIFFVGDGTQSN